MSSRLYQKYFDAVLGLMQKVMDNELDKIEQAAAWLAEEVKKDKIVHVYGTGGHNFMIACEMFSRAGSLLNYNLIIPGGTPCFEAHPSTENVPGLVAKAFDYYRVKEGDLMFIINVNGINSTTIDSALECRKRNIRSVGISSKSFATHVEPDAANRHPSKQNLHDLVDLHIDCYVPVGDMILELEKIHRKTGASSTPPLALIVQLINARAIEMLVDQGITPDFYMSGNTKDGWVQGNKLTDKWYSRIKHL
jgi:uncharacterized phosphosugar-binding protein